MNEEDMKKWIDNATYAQLLARWRNAPIGSPWFAGEIGKYYEKVFLKKKEEVGQEVHSATSKRIGWNG